MDNLRRGIEEGEGEEGEGNGGEVGMSEAEERADDRMISVLHNIYTRSKKNTPHKSRT